MTRTEKKEEIRISNGLAQGSALDAYLKAIHKIKGFNKFSEAEKNDLFKKSHAGDENAKTKLIESNLCLVASLAPKYQHLGVDMADLIQEGNIALIMAVDNFDTEMGTAFSTYATKAIERAMLKAVQRNSFEQGYSAHDLDIQKMVSKAIKEFETTEGRSPSWAEVMGRTGLSSYDVAESLNKIMYLDAPASDEDDYVLGDTISAGDDYNPENRILRTERENNLKDALEKLSEAEYNVIIFRVLGGLTTDKVANILGLDRKKVQLLELQAHNHLGRELYLEFAA